MDAVDAPAPTPGVPTGRRGLLLFGLASVAASCSGLDLAAWAAEGITTVRAGEGWEG